MMRKGLVSAAAAVLALGSVAWADDSQSAILGDSGAPQPAGVVLPVPQVIADAFTTPIYGDDAAAAAAPRAPLMWALDQVGLAKPLDSLHLNLYGYIDMGYLYDFTVPHDLTPAKAAPGDAIYFPGAYKNAFIFDQADFSIERAVDATKGQFDIGGKIEAIFGTDAFYTHSNGILDNTNKHGDSGPDDQLDLEQAYLTFAIPVGGGLTIKAGKFDTLLGYETINPTTNAFYTHSYIFSYGVPLTQTGILGTYNITDSLAVTAGVTRGWNQSTSDNNGAVDFLGSVGWQATKDLNVTVNLSEGPESTDDNKDYWTVPEVIVADQVSDQLNVAADLLYGDASSIAQWYAAAGYATYKLDKFVAVNLRGEFYHDGRGFTTGIGGTDLNFTEATAGLAVTPLPDSNLFQSLTVRPEVRGDFCDHGVFDGSKFTQLTAALDVYWKF